MTHNTVPHDQGAEVQVGAIIALGGNRIGKVNQVAPFLRLHKANIRSAYPLELPPEFLIFAVFAGESKAMEDIRAECRGTLGDQTILVAPIDLKEDVGYKDTWVEITSYSFDRPGIVSDLYIRAQLTRHPAFDVVQYGRLDKEVCHARTDTGSASRDG